MLRPANRGAPTPPHRPPCRPAGPVGDRLARRVKVPSLAQLEQEFRQEVERDRRRRERLQREVARRARKRSVERARRRGSFRFWLLVVALVATAALVAAAMFEALYLLLS